MISLMLLSLLVNAVVVSVLKLALGLNTNPMKSVMATFTKTATDNKRISEATFLLMIAPYSFILVAPVCLIWAVLELLD